MICKVRWLGVLTLRRPFCYNGVQMKRLYILAGANGSGKSTISKVLLPAEEIVYINPDDIAKELNPQDPLSVRILAGRETLRRINALLDEGRSFAIESTLSGSGYVGMIEKAKKFGYDVTIAYVYVDTPDLCLERIKARVLNGGHDVPERDVRRRYERSKVHFVKVYAPLADHWMLYYNGGNDFLLVAHGNGQTEIVAQKKFMTFMEDLCLT